MKMLNFMPHQEEALNRTEQFNCCAYYLDMGLGKTFVGAEKMYLLNNSVNLVICQKSKIDDWVQHFKDYYPSDRVMNLTKKSEAINFRTLVDTKELYKTDIQIVGVINYETAFRRDWLLKLQGFTLMLDESSLITNETAKRSKFILKMKPESVILLSGTPTAGKYERLWSQVQLLGWNITKKAFYNSYVVTEWVENGDGFKREVITGYKHTEHLKKKLASYGCIFMKTSEVLELPEQTEQKIFFKPWLDAVYNAAKDKKLTVGGTVHVVITDSDDYGEASSTLVQYVQQTLDPEENAGEGYGLAPIGHVVSVASALPVSIEVKTTVTFEEGHNWSNTKAAIAEAVDAYFLELRKNWSETSQTIVRVSQIENRILGVDGVVDVTGTKLNGTASNMTLTEFCIPKLGGVSA